MKKFFLLAVLSGVSVYSVYAQWSNNPVVNNAICTEADYQEYPQVISDGNGGAIITWQDKRNGNDKDIYAQKVNADGVIQWTAGGVLICSAPEDQQTPVLVSDGAGGAIIAWEDYFSGNWDIYAQRINSSGVAQWTPGGEAVCTITTSQNYLDIISDGAGGAIMAWEDNDGTSPDIYIQRINASGLTQWTAGGVAICTATGNQYTPKLAEDESGGAIIVWEDQRGVAADIYAQHINASGVISGLADGLVICDATDYQFTPAICSDGAGGAVFTWQDKRSGNWDIYAQKVISGGALQWTANGVAVNTVAGDQQYPQLVSDQNGGAIIAWQDGISDASDIYAQHISSAGNLIWTAYGVAVTDIADNQSSPQIIADNSGGAIIAWLDTRNGNINPDIYAQFLNVSGVPQWTADGTGVCLQTANQSNVKLVSDGNGGAIFTWDDTRTGSTDIYAQNICASGWLGLCTSSISDRENSSAISLATANNILTVQFENIHNQQSVLSIVDISGKLLFTENNVNTTNRFEINTSAFSSGIYLVILQSGSATQTAKFFKN